MTWLCVALGAAVGAPLRYLLSRRLDRLPASGAPGSWALPWGTLAVNVVGSLVLGWSSARALDGALLALVGVGFCGGLTTWSGFAVQLLALGWRRGSAYAALTIGLSLGACALSFLAGA